MSDNKQKILIGKNLKDATEILRNSKWRIVAEDNVDYIITHDLDPERYNLYLEKGVVIDVKFF
jgi:hypothetical protein